MFIQILYHCIILILVMFKRLAIDAIDKVRFHLILCLEILGERRNEERQ